MERNSVSKTFRAVVVRDGSMCFIPLDFDPKAVFGKVRAPVVVTVNGFSYRSTIAAMGGPPCIPLRKSHREAAGLEGGETISVTLTLDTEKREIKPPSDLAKALKAAPRAWERWQALSFSHQKEHVEAVADAKKPETRARRIARAVAALQKQAVVLAIAVLAITTPALAQGIEGRWKLLAAEDLRADGTVARYPWGRNAVGSIVVERGWCYVQIMSGDVPSFTAGKPVGEQMSAALLSTYIAYAGACTIDEKEGSVTLKVDAAWRANYVGTEQKRYFKIDGKRLVFGPEPNSIRAEGGNLTRRLTLERQ